MQALVRKEELDLGQVLDGPKALEILLEIGIEKLKRDHTFTVLNHSLASRDDLEEIFKDEIGRAHV